MSKKTKGGDTDDIAVEKLYGTRTQHESILKSSDMYIGSTNVRNEPHWIYNENGKDNEAKIIKQNIDFIPGFLKIYDEIVINARDAKVNDETVKNIKITIDKKTGKISCLNDGKGIRIEMYKDKNIYLPTLIFGTLLSSGNYDKKGKTTGGKHGLGAKLTNIFSKQFEVDVHDQKNQKSFHQKWKKNMFEAEEPVI